MAKSPLVLRRTRAAHVQAETDRRALDAYFAPKPTPPSPFGAPHAYECATLGSDPHLVTTSNTPKAETLDQYIARITGK